MRASRLTLSAALVACAAVAVPQVALAWAQSSSIEVRVHGHEFNKVAVDNSDCSLRYKLFFSAPAERYKILPSTYRFRARIRLQGGRTIPLPLFTSSRPGERVFSGSFDTQVEGCWGNLEQKLLAVDIEGCRGRDCTPAPLR